MQGYTKVNLTVLNGVTPTNMCIGLHCPADQYTDLHVFEVVDILNIAYSGFQTALQSFVPC